MRQTDAQSRSQKFTPMRLRSRSGRWCRQLRATGEPGRIAFQIDLCRMQLPTRSRIEEPCSLSNIGVVLSRRNHCLISSNAADATCPALNCGLCALGNGFDRNEMPVGSILTRHRSFNETEVRGRGNNLRQLQVGRSQESFVFLFRPLAPTHGDQHVDVKELGLRR
jgi:hypothetical protein